MADSVTLAGYKITLTNVTCDAINMTQTFTYHIEIFGTPPHGISSFALALCAPDIHNVISSSATNDCITITEDTNGAPCFRTPPPNPEPTVPQQIKFVFAGGNDCVGTGQDVTFTLAAPNGCFIVDNIDIALHAGEGVECTFGQISGPTCEAIPPPKRGIRFDKLETTLD